MLGTSQWLETKWPSIIPEGCWTGRSLTVLVIARSLLASMPARVTLIRHCRQSFISHLSGLSSARSKGLAIVSCSGQVLKAWDVGVLSMERGEVSIFLCAPEYAYGLTGNPNKIPPNSAVVFEVGALAQQFRWRVSFSVTQIFLGFIPLRSVSRLSVHKYVIFTTHTLGKIITCHLWNMLLPVKNTFSFCFKFVLYAKKTRHFCLLSFPPPTVTLTWAEARDLFCFI